MNEIDTLVIEAGTAGSSKVDRNRPMRHGFARSARHAERVRTEFDRLWQDFGEWTPSVAFQAIFRRSVIEEVRRRLEQRGNVRILEIGCGHGTWTEMLFREFAGEAGRIRYLGIDFSEPRVRLGQQRLAEFPTAELRTGDGETFEPDAPFDLVLVIEVIAHQLPHRHRVWIERMQGWLGPGGSAIVIDKERFSKHAWRVMWDRFKRHYVPGFLRGRAYYFPEHFSELVTTLHYPRFGHLRHVAMSLGMQCRSIEQEGSFRALICERTS